MHKQGEIGSPLCKVLAVEDYIYRGETKTDRYSVRYEWLQSLQSIPEGTQSYSTKFFSMRSVVFLHDLHVQWPQLSTMRNIVAIKESFQLTSLVFFFFYILRSGVVSKTAIARKYAEYAHFRQTEALHVQMAHPRRKNL